MKKKPRISLVVATEKSGFIGKDNELLWHLPADLKFFKETTSGHCIIMGRKTFESLKMRALPNRKNIVISRQSNYLASNRDHIHIPASSSLVFFNQLEEAIDAYPEEDEIFIIGGGEIYRQALSLADRIYRTLVDTSIEGDTRFPSISDTEWTLTASQFHPIDEKHAYSFDFQTFDRIPTQKELL